MGYQYTPTSFMLPTSHYDKAKADRAVAFVRNLRHTKGKWAGKSFILLPWQEQIVRDLFGVVKPDGKRQFRSAYVEIPKKNGKSELAAAIALYLLFADNEMSAECMARPPTASRHPSCLTLQSRWWRCLLLSCGAAKSWVQQSAS